MFMLQIMLNFSKHIENVNKHRPDCILKTRLRV